jgi:hypothetical protein
VTSHQLAHFLLEHPDAPLATVDEGGYHEAGTCYPLYLLKKLVKSENASDFDLPLNKLEKSKAILTIVVA